ncbi:LuxR C-terminal-related transcriptional regulator [Desulfovibrio sp. SGI.169]|uniref:helix-turn-helix transcriptional regulator n=1 Tax=Desulfovibrio sp. SGI.169 TaxID=3420561 RepID=UPI003CFE5E8D
MAERLFITPKTVHNHLFNARKKLSLHKTVELFRVEIEKEESSEDNIYLTSRWSEVLEAYLDGLTDKKIAEQLGIGYSAVRRHKERMKDANGCNSMRELGAFYKRGRKASEDKTHDD